MDEGRRLLIAAAVVALGLVGCGKDADGSKAAPTPTPTPTSTPTPKADATCEEAGRHWADYLNNNVASARRTQAWRDLAKDLAADCERGAWPAAERTCWAAISDMASHQACLDLRAKRK